MRGREHVPAAEAEQLIRPRAVAPEPPLLALQRAAGNRAVTALLAREDKKTPASDQPPRAGGWNEKPQGVGGSHRFPVTGLAGGNRKTDAQDATRESAVGSAVVVVPDAADLSKPFEVLLLFHGVGIGYRERTKPAPSMPVGDPGTVRDVEADLIPQQLAHSDRNIVGVLAQGLMGGGGRFGITDPNAYVLDVLKKAAPAIQKELPTAKCPADPAPARTILAGHSGGGPEATAQADAATPATAPKDKAQWINRPRLMIFDGIHGPDELGKVVALAKRWVKEDIGIVTSEGKAALAERGLKLRSTFSTGGWKGYTAYNVGGSFQKKKVEDGKVVTDDKGDPVMVEVKVDPANALRGRLKALIEAEAKDPDVAAELLKQYIVEGPLGSSHERTMGVGKSPEELKQKRDASPTGLTAPSDKGVPHYDGGGFLEGGLKKLPGDAKLHRTPRTPEEIETARAAANTQATGRSQAQRDMARELGLIFPGDPDPTARWFADHVPYATFMGVEIAASQNSTTGGVHQTMLDLLAAAETQLVAQGMPRAGEAAPENPPDPELAGFTIRDISGLRQPRPATDQADGVSLHCYGMAVDVNVSRNPFVRRSGAAMVTRAVALMRGTEYILDSATGHDTASNAWDNLHAGSENLKAYFRLDRAGVERQLRTHQRARDMGDVTWWLEQIRADRDDEDRNRNWVGGSPTRGYMDLPKAFVTILAGTGLRWGGTLAGGKDIMHFDARPAFRARRQAAP